MGSNPNSRKWGLTPFLGLVLSGSGVAHAECVSPHPRIQAIADKDDLRLPDVPKISLDAARKKFAKAYAPIDALVYTEGTSYSASKTLEKLWRLYGLARASGECSPELSQLLTTIAVIEFKRSYPVEATVFAESALSINDLSTPDAADDAIDLHYLVAEAADDPAVGIQHMEAALAAAPLDPKLELLERFGLRQRLGYWLHEAKRTSEARDNNLRLLSDLEREYGKEDANLLGVLENLAQNNYELKQFDSSEAYLKRCMALAVKHQRLEVESRMLFQLGVLAYERGSLEEARSYMKARVEHAQRNPGKGLLEQALSTRDQLEERILADKR